MNEPDRSAGRATVAVYDRPRWWRTRRAWQLALPVVASIGSLVALYYYFT